MSEAIEQFVWEPQNTRFALLTEDKNGHHNINFYNMYLNKGNTRVAEVNLSCTPALCSSPIDTVSNKPCNRLVYSLSDP